MYRLGFILVAILAVALGLVVGTLNHHVVEIDLLWFQVTWPVGLTMIAALAVGVAAGIVLCWLFSVLPLRMELRRTRRAPPAREESPPGAQ